VNGRMIFVQRPSHESCGHCPLHNQKCIAMKFKFLTFSLFLGALVLISCKKEKAYTPQPPEYWGEASAVLDGQSVDFFVYATHVQGEPYISILIDTLNKEGFKRGRISILKIPFHTGKYKLFEKGIAASQGLPYSIYTALSADGDAVLAYYNLVEVGTLSYLELKSYDESSQEITGTFEATFAIDSIFKNSQPFLDDTLKFTQGYFHTKIFKF
jgi:hypothetical protein